MTFVPVPRPRIMDIAPYVPGESKAEAVRVIKLAANENPLGPSPKAMEAYSGLVQNLHRYPDGASVALRAGIAGRHGIDSARIVCGTGSDEIITLLCKAFAGPGDEVLYSEFGFLMYPIAALAAGAQPVKAPEPRRQTDLQSLLDHVTEKTKIVFLANPNNPTGYMLTAGDVRHFRRALPEHIILVLDSAYAEYVTDVDYSDGIDMVNDFPNVVMLRTFSKIYGLSSLRVGWSYSSLAIADILNRVRGVFNICTPAQVCAGAAIDDIDFVGQSISLNKEMLEWSSKTLENIGFEVYPSAANFLLFSTAPLARSVDSSYVMADELISFLKQAGILLRPTKSYNLPDCVRMTIGQRDDMEMVVLEMNRFLKSWRAG